MCRWQWWAGASQKLQRSKQNKDPIQKDFHPAIDSNDNGRLGEEHEEPLERDFLNLEES